jgi:DNA polymerase elongation subunit (family B)
MLEEIKSKRKFFNSYSFKDTVVLEYQENGIKMKEVHNNFDWYLVVTLIDFQRIEKVIEDLKSSRLLNRYEVIGDYVKLFTENKNTKYEIDGKQSLIKWLKDNDIKPLESDLSSDKRYCVDRDIEIEDHYSILYFDIETDDSKPTIQVGSERILSLAAIDREGTTYYLTNPRSEKKLLEDIFELFQKYDIITGWNSGPFDLTYIKERMKFWKIQKFWKGITHIDMLDRFRHIFRFDNHIEKFSLEYISQHFLGHGKVKHDGIKIIELYRKYPDKLKEYNIQDVVLLKELDAKIGCLDMMILQCQWCKTFPSQFYISELLDNYILRVAHANGVYCPTRDYDTEDIHYQGAFVFEPNRGVHRNVHIFDFKSLYPTLIMSSNIGFDTLDEDGKILNPGTGKHFRDDKSSIIKLTIEGLIGKRKEYKKKKIQMIHDKTNSGPEWERVVSDEIVVKELSNSVYGIMGKRDGRWYSYDVATSITMFGQWVLKFAKQFFEEEGFSVIYGDTDSTFVKDDDKETLKLEMKKTLDKFHKKLQTVLKEQYNMSDCRIELEYEKTYGMLLMVDKKTYTGRLSMLEGKETNEMYTRGMDYIKKNNISIACDKQLELIKRVLYSDKFTVDEAEDFIQELLDFTRTGQIKMDDLIIQVKLSRPIETYKTNLPHVNIAKQIIAKEGVLQSNEIEYIVVDSKTKKNIIPEEYQGEYDKLYYWNNKIYPMLQRVLEVVFPNNNWQKYHFKKFVSERQMTLL